MAGRHSKGGIGGFLSGLRVAFNGKPGRHAVANRSRTTVRGSSSGIQGRGRTEFIGGTVRSAPLFGTSAQLAQRRRTGNPLGIHVGPKHGSPSARNLSRGYWR